MTIRAGQARTQAIVAVAALYFAAAKLGLSFAQVHPSATAIWPPTGIAIAALLLLGRGVWPGVFLGALAANLTTAGSLGTCLGIASGNTLEGVVAAWLVERFARGRQVFERPLDILRFAGYAGLGATAVSATVGVASLCLGGIAEWSRFREIWITWWFGDAVGAVLAAPPLLLWGLSPKPGWRAPRAAEYLSFLGIVGTGGWLIFQGDLPLAYLCAPPLLLLAFRFPPRETSAAVLVLAAVALPGVLHGRGPFQGVGNLNGSLLLLQTFLGILGVTTLALSAVVESRRKGEAALRDMHGKLESEVHRRTAALVEEVHERRRAERLARESEARLTEAQALAHVGNWEWDLGSDRIFWSEELYRIHGLRPGAEQESLDTLLEHVHPHDRDALRRALERSCASREPFSLEHRIVRPGGDVRILESRGRVVQDAEGRVIRMIGTSLDVTEMKAALDNLLYSEVARNVQSGLCVFKLEDPDDDASLTLIAANPAAVRLTGLPAGSQLGRTIDEIAPGLRPLGFPRRLAEAAREGEPTDFEEVFYGDGRIRQAWWSFKAFPMPGRCVGLVFEDVTQRRKAHEALARMAAVLESTEDAVLCKTLDGVITHWNRGAEKVYGWSAQEALGKPISLLVPPESQDEVQGILARIRRGERIQGFETVHVRKDASRIHVSLSIAPLLDPSGAVVGASSIARDITQAKQAQEALRLSSLRHRLILDGALDAVVTMDTRGRITGWNPQAERLFDWSKSEVLGRSMAETLIPPSHREAHRKGLERFLQEGVGPLLNTRIEVTALKRDGTEFPVEMSVTPVRTDGALLFSAFIRDITERRLAQEQVQLYADIARNIQLGFCVFRLEDPEDDRSLRLVALNPAAAQMLKLGAEQAVGRRLDELAPGLRAHGIPRTLSETILRKEATAMQEVRYGSGHLPEEWWSFKAFPMPSQSVGVAFEKITERKRAEAELMSRTEELARHSRQMTLLNELSNVLRATMSPAEAYAVVSKFALQILPEESGALCVQDPVRRTVETVCAWGGTSPGAREFSPDDCWAFRRGRLHRVDNPRAEVLCGHLGSPAPAGYLCAPVVAWGETLGILHFHHASRALTDAEERVAAVMTEHVALALATLRLQEKLKKQADHDPLTGLYNRRYLDKALEREVLRAAKRSTPLCLAMLDLDHFKRFNDTYGHQAGDALLEQVGGVLRSSIRGRDIACRYGGEEFLILFPDAPWPDTLHRIKELQKEIRELSFVHEGQSHHAISVSIGVAMFPEHAANPRDLLKVADAALYRAKGEGRDRVVVGSSDSLSLPC